ncbi:MAG: ABC transporter ATP-binding protein [Chlamydiales bacterium]|nr:ABC transporter ATP-binding protein [Chlamydiales bacterium]
MTPVLSVKNLTKTYGKKKKFVAVDAISFDLQPGEILGLLGPNGSGKTTTIQMLLGTLSATSGQILYFDKDFIRFRSESLQHISFASTYTSLPHVLTIAENLRCFGRFYGISDPDPKIDPLLDLFGLLDKKDKLVSSLSAGQITRLMLVKALFTEPKIVLLDEPTASLDPDISRDVCQFILRQREELGISILFTSHKMEEVADLCDRAIFLKNGRIIANDLPENLAKSVSCHRLRLQLGDGMKGAIALAERKGLVYIAEHRFIELSLEEKEIPLFLHALAQEEISYVSIQIREPSLQDYFIHITEKPS